MKGALLFFAALRLAVAAPRPAFGDLRPGAFKLYAFEGAPDGVWEDPDFMKEFSAAGVEVHMDEGETKNTDVPLIRQSDLAPVLKKLGLE